MSSALFVVSEHGYWGEECIEPLTTLSDAGLDITVATPTGEPPVLDERSVDPEEVGEDLSEHVREVHETDERLNNPIPLAQTAAEDYDTVVFPGGHGAEWDITQDVHARELLRESVAGDDGKALVVCHTVGILAFTRNADGEFLADGRSVTGFPNAWEEGIVDENDLLPDGRKLPYWVEDEVKAVGADWDAELDADTSVTVDGDLITARGPPSSAAAARTLLDELGIETSA
ncbi:type 1 glutamine amidotransferase domain-containing protein [Haloarcula hispanica]|uniref:Type 1 glutamine amidotransferase domain-containing protein n=1 Tax=Haloarcula hispanica TaxID=51589 RepID=A0A482TCN5_HALHI|nr:type 1 glutamine amidotransferase domain-containing protein [Haloarcula hispanica]MCJ0620296.1 type 1 glutamine amidotransferase domain-containing protein [Haloarcula hispanica]RYJ10707.1 type 1 glutamine amidotransferase domain-containing protein [Haloarcula hispanica]